MKNQLRQQFYILDYILYKAQAYCKWSHDRKLRGNQDTIQACYEKCIDYKLFDYNSNNGKCVCVADPNEDGGCTLGLIEALTMNIYKVIK